MLRKWAVLGGAIAAVLSGCGKKTSPESAIEPPKQVDPWEIALDGAHRSPQNKARDEWRHPQETLEFFGVTPDMTVVEVWPGGGWYSEVIAPYLATGDGVFYAANFDPARSERAAAIVKTYTDKFTNNPQLYGDVRVTILGGENAIAPDGVADVVLTFRNVHNWMPNGDTQNYFQQFYDALKPGGVLGVVEHRADENSDDDNGYVKEATVKAFAAAAGFEFEGATEINANPSDTKDHPFGVWTLPPNRRSSASRGTEDPDFDRTKYDAIGESDRMTLKFRKPIAADGALLE